METTTEMEIRGVPVDLDDRPASAGLADQTLVVRILSVRPRRIKLYGNPMWQDGEVTKEADIGELPSGTEMNDFDALVDTPPTRLDLNASRGDPAKYKCIAFKLEGAGLKFMKAHFICGGHRNARTRLYEPRRRSDTLATMIVAPGVPPTAYVIGVDVTDKKDKKYVTPIFIDPKVRNDG